MSRLTRGMAAAMLASQGGLQTTGALRRPEETRASLGPPTEGPPTGRCTCGAKMIPAEPINDKDPRASLAACGVVRCPACGMVGTAPDIRPEVVAALRRGV